MAYKHSYGAPRRRLKIVPLIIAILAVALVLAGVYFLVGTLGKEDAHAEYEEYNEKNKGYGTVEQFKEESKNFYISVFYPKTDNKNLNKIVTDTYESYINEEKKNKNTKEDVLYMDYSIDRVFKQYVTIKLDFKRIDFENKKTLVHKQELFTFDSKTNKKLTVSDCLRGKYMDLLTSLNASEVTATTNTLKVGTDALTIYTDDKLENNISIKYTDNKDYIKLANKNIPSNAPTNIAAPKQQKEIDPNKKMIAITMDDGPHKTLTQRAMTAFEKYDGRATFFELGNNVVLYPDVVKDVYERGFELASHTKSHSQLTKLSADKLDSEIGDTQNAVFKITGIEPVLVRPPYGAQNDTVKAAFKSYGLTSVLWDIDTLDWKTRNAQKVCDSIVNEAADGKIVLIHDIHETSIAGLELALPILHEKGYQFVTVSTLYQYKGTN